jgi:hypothetical protein
MNMEIDFFKQISDALNASNEITFIIEPHQDNLNNAASHIREAFSEQTYKGVNKLKIMSPGLHVFWKYKKEEENFIQGEFNIFDPFTAFAHNDAGTVIYSLPQEPDFLCYIDSHPIICDDVYALAAIDEVEGTVLGYSDSGNVFTLSINWEEYHECLIHSLGYPHWQMLFVEKLDSDQVKWLNEQYLPKMVADIKLCFPKKNLASFISLMTTKNARLTVDFF